MLKCCQKSSKIRSGLTNDFTTEYSFRLRRILLMKERKREEGRDEEKEIIFKRKKKILKA